MLEEINKPFNTVSINPKQIVIKGTSTVNEIIYTVPEGRIFKGYLLPTTYNNYLYYPLIVSKEGVSLSMNDQQTSAMRTEIVLVAGTSVATPGYSPTGSGLIGVEEDAN